MNEATVCATKPGVMLVNTSRGALSDTPAIVAGLKRGQIGLLALDVYEEEDVGLFTGRRCAASPRRRSKTSRRSSAGSGAGVSSPSGFAAPRVPFRGTLPLDA